MTLGLCACAGSASGNADGLQAGFSRVSAMPTTEKVHIAGGDAATDISDGYLDELAVTCVALKQGEQTILIYTCDIVDIDKAFYLTIENAIVTATGIPPENIILNATHTHSAPTLKNKLPGKDEYLAVFNKACADAATKAIADLSAAKLSYGSVDTGLVRVRHYLMNDGTSYGNGHGSDASGYKDHLYEADSECQVLRLTRAAEDKKDIVLMNLGAQLKNDSPMDMTFVVTCSEDNQGYFPTEIAKTERFYEYDQTKYAMGTGEAVAARFVEILTSLQKNETPTPLPKK